ncbi:MAG TPA: hypothetical protein VFG60_06715 [Burkholderiaceae bacterium]|nr:hypothetical protein [Burkholderiaceae bacterium]
MTTRKPPEQPDASKRRDDTRPAHTTPARRVPRLPHEHDESSDSQQQGPNEVGRRGFEDVQRGLVDTDRGPVTDSLYEGAVRPAHEATRDRAAPDQKSKRRKAGSR